MSTESEVKNIEIPRSTVFKNSKELLTTPKKKEKTDTFIRPHVEYDSSISKKKFLLLNKEFEQQFAHLYMIRLSQMKDNVIRNALKQLGKTDVYIAKRVVNLEFGVETLVVGTLYKDMKLKPNILLEYTKERYVDPDIPDLPEDVNTRKHRVSDQDILILEDETGRTKLVFDNEEHERHLVDEFVTGVIFACLGQEDHNGNFNVKQYFTHGFCPQTRYPHFADDMYVALVSGILVGGPRFNIMAVQTMVDYLCGATGSSEEHFHIVSKILRMVIAGNSVAAPDRLEGELFGVRGSLRPREMTSLVQPMRSVDNLVRQLASTMEVDVMPGEQDPTNPALPQQPLHPSMLPECANLTTTRLVTNPYAFTVQGVEFLGTSGQNIDDLRKYSANDSTLDMMEKLLNWAHIAPTAPDTLDSYPFKESDPFVIEKQPHIFFVGNQERFESKLVYGKEGQKTLIVSVPSFSLDPTLVLVNLRTFACHPISFYLNTEWI